MSSRPPGRVIALPSSVTHWHTLRMRRRKWKIAIASVGLAGLLVALLEVVFEGNEADPTEEGSASFDESPFRPSSGEAPSVGDAPAWFTTSGSGRH
jgi:hypothetical protein